MPPVKSDLATEAHYELANTYDRLFIIFKLNCELYRLNELELLLASMYVRAAIHSMNPKIKRSFSRKLSIIMANEYTSTCFRLILYTYYSLLSPWFQE